MNRHWAWLAVGMALGIGAFSILPGTGMRVGIVGFTFFLALWTLPSRLPAKSYFFIALLAFSLGLLLAWISHNPPEKDPLFRIARNYPGAPCALEGWVAEAPIPDPTSAYRMFLLTDITYIRQGRSYPTKSKCLVRWKDPAGPLFDGEKIHLSGLLYPDISDVNHGVKGYEAYCRNRGIHSRVVVQRNSLDHLPQVHHGPYWLSRWRTAQGERLRAVLPESAWPFIAGVWLGERTGINREVYQYYVLSGAVHILSVSGLHVGLIYLSFAALLKPLLRYRRSRALLLFLIIFLYAFITGARPATLRSALMVALFLAYEYFEREPDSWSALGLSGFIQLAASPFVLFDTGFQLSYLCMASLFLYEPLLRPPLQRLPRFISAPLATTLAAQWLVLPAAAAQFYVIPLAGLLVNFVAIPLLGVVLWLAMALTAAVWILPPIAPLIGAAIAPAVAGIETAARLGATSPGGYFYVNRPTLPALIFYFAAAYMFWILLRHAENRPRRLGIALLLAALSLLTWSWRLQPARIDFLDVGHADAAVIVTPGGSRLLVDGGDLGYGGDDGRQVVLPFLRAHGINRLDAVIATHSDSDHLGGLLRVVADIPVAAAYLPPEEKNPSALETEFIQGCVRRGVPVYRIAAGAVIPGKGAAIAVLHPPARGMETASENDRSLVLRIAWPGLSVLLAGDLEEAGERRLIQSPCTATVLKAPHHGSATSNSKGLIDAVQPAVVVISTRATSRWKAIGKGVLERYRERPLSLWRTDWQGGLRVQVRRGRLVVDSARRYYGCDLTPDDSDITLPRKTP